MAYGTLKADTIIYDDSGDQTLSLSTLGSINDKAPKASPTFTGTVAIPNIANVETAITAKAPLASPTFTGTVAIPNIANVETAITGKQAADADLTALSSCQTGAATALALLTATEVGVLDGVTATTAEVNILDGVTSTTAELNLLDGVTATTAELNYTDGVTSNIQTQLNAKGAGDAVLASDQNWTGAQRGNINTLTSAASITIDFGVGNNFKLETGHGTISFANPSTEVAGQSGSIFIVQGSTTCAAPSWGNQYFFPGGTAPSLTGTTGKIARIDYIVQEAGKIHCVATDNLALTS